uniref:BTB domain-containing protein n=1 Tax=Panagrolaimus superbus TaxID=310955 RepID=A0A914YQU2_9BILA
MAVSNNFFVHLQQIKFDLFKSQDAEIGRFDVSFEIEGKQLFAHKAMLNLVSDTFDSMLSDRWSSKDEPIQIKGYSYDNFYQFLAFLYSAQCQITAQNIYALVDMAEFYQKIYFKLYTNGQKNKQRKSNLIIRNFNQNDVIKSEISDFLPHIHFKQIDHSFLTDFVVPRGFIFSSYNELSKILKDSSTSKTIQVTNDHGETLRGKLFDGTIIQKIQLLNKRRSFASGWKVKLTIPTTSSPLNVRDDVEWYLVYCPSRKVSLKRRSRLDTKHYLLAEMMLKKGKSFRFTRHFTIETV